MIKKLFNRFINFSENTINKIENSKTPLYYFIFTFLFIIQLRNLLEDFSGDTGLGLMAHIHFILYYICILSAILLIIKLITKEKTLKTFRPFSLFFSFILLGPTIDIIFTGFRNRNISYVFPESIKEVIIRFFTFFGKYTDMGATPGMRIHLFIILSLIFIYTLVKTNKNIKKVFFSVFLSYCILFISSILPTIIKFLTSVSYNDQFLSLFFFVTSIILVTILFYLNNKPFFKIIIKDMRLTRMLFYILMIILGVAIGYKYYDILRYGLPDFLFLNILTLIICLVLGIFFSIVTNNIVDYNIDKISNKERPLFKENFSLKYYKLFGIICLVLSLFGAFIVSYLGFFFIFLFIGNYFIYSMPPIRFKRVPILSKLTISLNSLFLTLLGFSFFLESSDVIHLTSFPIEYIIFFLLFTLAANFIDIKDYEGDKKEGIKTLPVLLGLEKSKKLIAFLFILPFLFIGFLNKDLMIICLLLSIVNLLLITDKNYNEKYLFLIMLFSIIAYILTLFIYIPI
ncbi:MAG: UbiA family prenyltransferase [Candidatus Nanoarchaeia archaeon]|nr:UbiA family prenyltransferase [Candidatus Nanoarchaeia archaeon]